MAPRRRRTPARAPRSGRRRGRLRVLVTGGAGYIGSVTAQALVDAGHEVVVLDDLSSGHEELVPKGVDFVRGAVGDSEAVARAIGEGVDGVVHFAARIEAGESMRRPEAYFAGNTAQTLAFLEHLIDRGVRRFVFSSTAAVYGNPARVPIEEDDPTLPTSVYGESKLLVERALRWLHELRGLRYASLRYFNAAGATDDRGELHDPETHLIPLVLRVALGGAPEAVIFGDDYPTPDGTCIRDYIHVADLADAHVRALAVLDGERAITCNVGNGTGYSVREVIGACRRVTGRDIPVRVAPRRAGDPPQLVASSARARRILGWAAAHPSLDEIVESAWRWHRRADAAPR